MTIYTDFEELNEDLEVVQKARPQQVTEDYFLTHIFRKGNAAVTDLFFNMYQDTLQWDWYDLHKAWSLSEPTPAVRARDEDGMYIPDIEETPENEAYVNGYTPIQFDEDHANWSLAEPVRPTRQTQEEWLATKPELLKLVGVYFDGAMCSATAEDMWGLSAVRDWVYAGNSTNFEFKNGTVYRLTPEKMADFETTWIQFRQQFFV